MWKDAYLQDRRLFYSIPLATHQTNGQNDRPNDRMPFPAPTYPNNRPNDRMPFPAPTYQTTVCMIKLAPNSPRSEITSFERGDKAGFKDGQAGGGGERPGPVDESVHV